MIFLTKSKGAYLFGLLTLLPLSLFLKADVDRKILLDEHFRGQTYQDPHLTTYIGIGDFRAKGETTLALTYTISSAGTYVLTADISSDVGTDSGSIIYINSSDVILDLSGHALTQSSSTASIDGILLNKTLANITIKNGSIRNVTENGISVDKDTTDLLLEDLFIRNCDEKGINFTGISGEEIKNCTIRRCDVAGCDGGGAADSIALYMDYCDFITVENSKFNLSVTTNDTSDAYGVRALNSKGCTFTNCDTSGHEGETIAAGCYVTTSTGFTFKNCTSNQNISTDASASEAYGFYLSDSNEAYFENCSADFNSSVNTTSGFHVAASRNNRFINCTAIGNEVTGAGANDVSHGFGVGTSENFNLRFEKCTAAGNQGGTASTGKTAGFLLEHSNFCVIEDCKASGNGGTVAFGVGIDLLGTCTLCLVQRCEVVANTSSTASQGIGIRDAGGASTNLLIDNLAFGNRDTTGSPANKNYSVLYSDTNVIQEVDNISLSTITSPTRKNISIIPA